MSNMQITTLTKDDSETIQQHIAVQNEHSANLVLKPIELQTMLQIAQACAASGFFSDIKDASQALVKMLAGRELGIPPVRALTSIHIIENKPSPSADVVAECIKRSGQYRYRVVQHDESACVLEWSDCGEVVGQSSFSIEDAQRAELTKKTNWKRYPRAMLFARALVEGKRIYAPDVLSGCYTPDELGCETDQTGAVDPAQWQQMLAAAEGRKALMAPRTANVDFFGAQPQAEVESQQPSPPTTVVETPVAQSIAFPPQPDPDSPATTEILDRIKCYLERLNMPYEAYQAILAKRGVKSLREMTYGQADDLLEKLMQKELGLAGNSTGRT